MATATLPRQDVENFEHKSIAGILSSDQAEGIVECFVAVMGNKDSVGDIILPRAFDKGLKKRMPRVVWGHDWNNPIGKVLEIYEVGPDDPRLAPETKQEGVTGALYAKVQFNLRSQKGKEAFENVLFFGEDQEWSIGYKTRVSDFDPRRKANLLKEVELYEVSPVLHGANSLTSTISIKDGKMSLVEEEVEDEESKADQDAIEAALDFLREESEFVAELNEHLGEEKADPRAGIPQEAITGEILRGRGPRRGNLEALLRYWRPIMKKPGGFRRCLVILADHPELYPLENICAWLHHETTGKWPNEGNHHGRRGGGGGRAARRAVRKLKKEDGTVEEVDIKVALEDFVDGTIVEADETHVIYESEGQLYAAEYAPTSDSGDFKVGEAQKVVRETVYVLDNGCGCGGDCSDCDGDCNCGGDCGKDALDSDVEEKIGRAISMANERRLRQAMQMIQEVLGEMDDSPVEEVKSSPVEMYQSGDNIILDTEAEHLFTLKSLIAPIQEYYDSETVIDDYAVGLYFEKKSEEHAAAIARAVSQFNDW